MPRLIGIQIQNIRHEWRHSRNWSCAVCEFGRTPSIELVGKNAIAVIMADLNSSLTAMDWLPKLSVGTALSGQQLRNNNNNNDTCKDKLGVRKAPGSPLDPGAVLDETEARQHQTRESKPPYSYANLITFAINSSPKKKMTLSEIYQWICDHFPYYKDAGNGWKVRLHFTFLGLRVRYSFP